MNELNYSSMDMAQETGLTTEGLRFYEKNGIIEVKKRENGYRVYDTRLTSLRLRKPATPMPPLA